MPTHYQSPDSVLGLNIHVGMEVSGGLGLSRQSGIDFLLSEAKSRLRDLIKQHKVHENL